MKLDIQKFGGRGASSSNVGGGSTSENKTKEAFNDFRFDGLKWKRISNEYVTANRVSKNEDRIIVKVSDNHIVQTTYGYALILDKSNVVFVKDWQVSKNFYGNEVMLTKKYFNVKQWGNHQDFFEDKNNTKWETWLKTAKKQKNQQVKWQDGKKSAKKYYEKLKYGG